MQDIKKEKELLAKLSPKLQAGLFLEQYQNNEDGLVVISASGALLKKKFSPKLIENSKLSIYYTLNHVSADFNGIKPLKSDISGYRGWAADIDPKKDFESEPSSDIFVRYNLKDMLKHPDRKWVREFAYLLQDTVHPILVGERGLPPSIAIFSGRGIQLVWYADKTYKASPENLGLWESLGRGIISTVGGDSVFNVDRLLRLPGGFNRKTDNRARIIWETDAEYSPGQIKRTFGAEKGEVSSNTKGVDPSDFKYVDWEAVFGVETLEDIDAPLLEKFLTDMNRNPALNDLYDGEPTVNQKDTSGSGFDMTFIGRLKALGYEVEDTLKLAMTFEHGSEGKRENGDARHFMRCWSRTDAPTTTTPEEDFEGVPYADPELKIVSTEHNADRAEKRLLKQYYFVAGLRKIIHVESKMLFDIAAIDLAFSSTHTGRKDEKPKASGTLVNHGRQVAGLTWLPGEDDLIIDKGIMKLNTFTRNPPPVVKYERDCTKPYHDLLAHVIPVPKQASLFLDWMAYTVQFPGKKINWHPILFSITEGVGKDTLLEVLIHAVGRHNTASLPIEHVIGQFNGGMAFKKLIILNEVETMSEGKAAANKLKEVLSSPPSSVSINEKGMPVWQHPNLWAVVMTSNSPRPIKVSKTARRTIPMHCSEEPLSHEASTAIWEWYEKDNGLDLMFHELLHRDISEFNPSRQPEDAEIMYDHKVMHENSMSNAQQQLLTLVDEREGLFARDVISAGELARVMKREFGVSVLSSSVRADMQELGFVHLSRIAIRHGKDVRKHSFWVIRNPEKYVRQAKNKQNRMEWVPVGLGTWKDIHDYAYGLTTAEDDFGSSDEDEIL